MYDQLRRYCEADLHLCFCIGKISVFSQCGSYVGMKFLSLNRLSIICSIFKTLRYIKMTVLIFWRCLKNSDFEIDSVRTQ